MRRDADVVVIGAGMAGLSTARVLAARGHDVVVLERFTIGHARGGSGGPTRIYRIAYELPRYVRMAQIALDRWRALEDAAGEPLMVTTGGVDLGDRATACAEAMRSCGASYTLPTAAEVRERWPALLVHDGERILVHEEAGVCLADATIAATARLAVAAGARIEQEVVVERLDVGDDGAAVVADGREWRARVVVVAAGGWAPDLLSPIGIDLPVQATQEQVTYFTLRDPSPLPTVIEWQVEAHGGPYALPDPRIPGAFKAALHHSGPDVHPDRRTFEPDPVRVERIEAFARRRYAAHAPTGVTETCLYASTPDEDFVLDRRGPIVVASPCSGHAFKFAPILGELIADIATDATPVLPLVDYALDRAGLADAGRRP